MTQALRQSLIQTVISKNINRDDAEDIVQEAFVREFSNRGYNPSRASFSTYMICVVRNKMIDAMRRSARREKAFDVDHFDTHIAKGEPEHIGVDEAALVHKAVEQLQPNYSEILGLIHGRDCSYRAASFLFGIPIGTVKSLASRSRQSLKQKLEVVCDNFLDQPEGTDTVLSVR